MSPASYVPRPATERALVQLEHWLLRSNAHAIVLSAAAGMGKSLLMRVFEKGAAAGGSALYVPYPALQPSELCAWALDALGEPRGDQPESRLVEVATSRQRGNGLLLLIDDAMWMPEVTARAVPELSRASNGSLRWVLAITSGSGGVERAGQAPETETVTLDTPLGADESAALLSAALERAGSSPQAVALFDSQTMAELHRRSGGVPARLLVEAGRFLQAKGVEVERPAPPPPSVSAAPPPPRPAPATMAPPPTRAQVDRPRTGAPEVRSRPPAPERPTGRRVGNALPWAGAAIAAGFLLGLGTVWWWNPEAISRGGAPPESTGEDLPAAAGEVAGVGEADASPPASSSAGETGGDREGRAIAAAAGTPGAPAARLPSAEPPPDRSRLRAPPARARAGSDGAAPASGTERGLLSDTGTISAGGCLSQSMSDQGVPASVARLIEREVGSLFDFRRSRPGDRFRVVRTRGGELVDFRYRISPAEELRVQLREGRYTVERSPPLAEPGAAHR